MERKKLLLISQINEYEYHACEMYDETDKFWTVSSDEEMPLHEIWEESRWLLRDNKDDEFEEVYFNPSEIDINIDTYSAKFNEEKNGFEIIFAEYEVGVIDNMFLKMTKGDENSSLIDNYRHFTYDNLEKISLINKQVFFEFLCSLNYLILNFGAKDE